MLVDQVCCPSVSLADGLTSNQDACPAETSFAMYRYFPPSHLDHFVRQPDEVPYDLVTGTRPIVKVHLHMVDPNFKEDSAVVPSISYAHFINLQFIVEPDDEPDVLSIKYLEDALERSSSKLTFDTSFRIGSIHRRSEGDERTEDVQVPIPRQSATFRYHSLWRLVVLIEVRIEISKIEQSVRHGFVHAIEAILNSAESSDGLPESKPRN